MIKQLLFLVPPRLGDALILTPALALLKQLQPDYHIDILAFSPLGASVYQNNPNCGHVYIASEIQLVDDFIRPYDLLVAAHRDSKILELTEQFKKPTLLIEPANLQEYQPQQALDFIQCVFSDHRQKAEPKDYQLFPSDKDKADASRLLTDDRKYIGLHLGCHSINKRSSLFTWQKSKQHKKMWPLKKFIELANQFKQLHHDYHIVLTGGDNEQHLANEFKKHIPDAISLVGKTDVLQLAALMQHFSVYVCPDTGTMHVACAMNTPLIALFGPTNVKRTGPYPKTDSRRVIETKDLSKLNPEAVLSVINELLK